VDGWYAWAHLLPPATFARNLTERHLRIIDSYISAPEGHRAAVKNPKLLGGPFMDFPENKVGAVQAMRDRIMRERGGLIALSRALEELDRLLQAEASGYGLEALYERVPEALQGYVELTYDLSNHPSFRLLEPLLYNSEYYDRTLQSLTLASISEDERPFVLSTPRIEAGSAIHLPIPFDDERVDWLFRLKSEPASLDMIQSSLDLGDSEVKAFTTLLTPDPPARYQRYTGEGVRWRYFGHACILVETAGFTALLDPVLSYTYENSISRYTYEDLPSQIDYVLITHNHQDHILFETLLQMRHKIGTVVVPRNDGGSLHDPSLALMLRNCGFKNVTEISELDQLATGDGSITGIPFFGEHGDLAVRSKMAYLIDLHGHTLLFAADSRNLSPKMYRHVQRMVGDVEVLFLGMECDGAPVSWIYGPLFSTRLDRRMDHSRRLAGSDYERAIHVVEQFRCKEVYVYAMGQEPWLNYIMSVKYSVDSNPIVQSNRLVAECRSRGIAAERLFGEKEILLPEVGRVQHAQA
jgi:L-ascorbate metabolism protein UlaG (beta-lactamase superfamily)